MTDRLIFAVSAAMFILIILAGMMVGGNLEQKRIYERCMKANGAMMHNDAVAKCQDVVK